MAQISSDIAVVVKVCKRYKYDNRGGCSIVDFSREDVESFDEPYTGYASLVADAKDYANDLNTRFGSEILEYVVEGRAR